MIKTYKDYFSYLKSDKERLERPRRLSDFLFNRPYWDLCKLYKYLRLCDYLINNPSTVNRVLYNVYFYKLKLLNRKYRTWFFPMVFNAGLRIHHLEIGGISVAPTAKIGKYFSIRQFCTIGYNGNDYTRAAVIDDYVDMSVGACIYGHVKVGRGARIGPYAVVTQNVPPYAIVAGNPAKIVGYTMAPLEIVEFEKSRYPEGERIPLKKLEKNYCKFFEKRESIVDYLSL